MSRKRPLLKFHTLNARDNSVIPWLYSGPADGDPATFRDLMQLENEHVRDMLNAKGIDYDDLKSALTPTKNGKQVVFFYTWLEYGTGNYAVDFAKKYLPNIHPKTQTSVLHGDLLGAPPEDLLNAKIVRANDQEINWRVQYAVYFSNLNQFNLEAIHGSLKDDPRYSGYIIADYDASLLDYFAGCLASQWIVHNKTIILTHGGDDPFIGSEDPVGYEFDSMDIELVSLIDAYYVAFFVYKIESEGSPRADADRTLTLAAATGEYIDIDTASIVVHPDKLEKYLLKDESKLRLMTSIGLQDVTPDELAVIIRERISKNYIYDIRFAVGYIPTFAVAADFETNSGDLVRRLLSLKFESESETISLVTMY
ncbi:hypothetical protein [Rathayibacter sp. AY1B5]|uniref:hypothetical protein n=1 Tax=Rathayibacter sp. AY1B5 TaxID=2080530 RepID=UPI0011B08A73|nr:hypothetical protein [Rathayibacter sp. AY1B5]